MGHDVPIVLGDTALGVAPHSGKAWAGRGTASPDRQTSQCHLRCTRAAATPVSALPLMPALLWEPWRDKDLPMAAAFEATPVEKITQRYKSS